MIEVEWPNYGQLKRSLEGILGERFIDNGHIENMPTEITTISDPIDGTQKKASQHLILIYCPDCSEGPYAHLYIGKPGLWLTGNKRTKEIVNTFCRIFGEEPSYQKIGSMSKLEKEELNFPGARCLFAGWGNTSSIRF